MMSAALAFLLKDEWTMGNGQCHTCRGLGETFCYGPNEEAHWGHLPACELAVAIKALGGNPFYDKPVFVRPHRSPASGIFWEGVNEHAMLAFKRGLDAYKFVGVGE